jgi:hypothetical protein
MRHRSLFCVVVLAFAPVLLAGCPGGNAGIGERCGSTGDCNSTLQCVSNVCVARCQRAPDCGDGYACDAHGLCQPAAGQLGDTCTSEIDCAAGLACELCEFGTECDQLLATCSPEGIGRPAGAACAQDEDCRNGTCALGHCVDLCRDTRDCGTGTSCALVPRIEADGAMFGACLQAHGALRRQLPVAGASDSGVQLPIPDSARSVAVTFSVDDLAQQVGAKRVISPSGQVLVDYDPAAPDHNYYATPVRHRPDFGQSTLAMPSSPDAPLEPGVYTLDVSSIRADGSQGTATPTATAVVKLDTSVLLDLHFYFLDFADHPCAAHFGGTLDAEVAGTAAFFQDEYLGQLRALFAHGGIALGTATYEDLPGHPDLDGHDVANAGELLALGGHDTGINVFFVRTLSPVGLQAWGPNPGPAGIAGTRQSGIVVSIDTLCYETWGKLARITAHELARYMGLYDNVELDATLDASHVDPIGDSDMSSSNLMFYSEMGGGDLSADQRDILGRSAVLR